MMENDALIGQQIGGYTIQSRLGEGTTVLLVVSEPEELAHSSDRVAILRGGRIASVVDQPIDAHRLTELMNSSEETS